jgi:hypothetical protein
MQIIPPVRAVRRYVQHLDGTPAQVFPLLCPVREADWIVGWDPLHVVSETGVAERDCVFVEMLKITPGVTACRLTIQLTATASGCDAEIVYAHTSLGAAGDDFVASFTEAFYAKFMQDWEARVNHYLKHGEALVI